MMSRSGWRLAEILRFGIHALPFGIEARAAQFAQDQLGIGGIVLGDQDA